MHNKINILIMLLMIFCLSSSSYTQDIDSNNKKEGGMGYFMLGGSIINVGSLNSIQN